MFSTYQIITMVLTVAFSVLAVFLNKLNKKISSAWEIGMVLCFIAIYFSNFLKKRLIILQDVNKNGLIFLLILMVLAFILAFFMVYLIKDDEKRRKICLWLAGIIFFAATLDVLIDVINRTGTLPGHLCRQISYGFPLVYFSKFGRKYLLNYFCYMAFFGGFVTIFAPDNYFSGNHLTYSSFDTAIIHAFMIILPIKLLAEKSVIPEWRDLYTSIAFWSINAAIALYSAVLRKNISGEYGGDMYFFKRAVDFVPTWLLYLTLYLGVATVIVVYKLIEKRKYRV